jgi:hypothetical protein
MRAVAAGIAWAGLGLAVLGASGCASAGRALGMSKVTPDEFRVVTKAPLVVPPDYALRPPTPGEPRPQELRPDSQARAALLGQNVARSTGEALLVNRAGVAQADPLIRYVVDDEFGDVAHKDKGFADQVLGANSGAAQPAAPAEGQAAGAGALNPTASASDLTGGQPVTITRGSGGVKLPGL